MRSLPSFPDFDAAVGGSGPRTIRRDVDTAQPVVAKMGLSNKNLLLRQKGLGDLPEGIAGFELLNFDIPENVLNAALAHLLVRF